MAHPISPQDVARLLAQPSSDMRAELAENIAGHLAGPDLAPSEIALARDIVRILAKDVETKVRAALSEGLRDSSLIPHDVALRLADDIDAVALPMLADSVVLTDDDLVAIVRRGSAGKQTAIAGRASLSETVSDVLIDHAAEPAVAALMNNGSANIAPAGLDRAVTRFSESGAVKAAMVHRPGLPMAVAERLVVLVSQELREHLLKAQSLPPGVASDIVLKSREHAVIHLSAGSSAEDLRGLVAQLRHAGRLTATMMFRALCTGDIAFFEAALAEKGDVPVENAQILVHDPSGRGFAALYRKAGLPDTMFPSMRAAVQVIDSTGFDGEARDLERFRARVLSRVLTLTEAVGTDIEDYLVDKLGDVLAHAHQPEKVSLDHVSR